jgi:hypothetical protein
MVDSPVPSNFYGRQCKLVAGRLIVHGVRVKEPYSQTEIKELATLYFFDYSWDLRRNGLQNCLRIYRTI